MNCGSKHASSVSHSSTMNVSSSHAVPSKKKKKMGYKRVTHSVIPIPPTKFLLGGNIRDPLNLTGMPPDDENAPDVTASPTPTDFLLGGNIHDPLNLKGIAATEITERPESAQMSIEASDESAAPVDCSAQVVEKLEAPSTTTGPDEGRLNGTRIVNLHLQITSDCRQRRLDRKDKIVSPVIPQPNRPLKTVPFIRQIITPDLGDKAARTPKFKEKNTRFQYGNYPRYYGYRNAEYTVDLRLEILERHRDFFEDKDVLDIGCNIGHVSLIIARSFGAKSVTGIDIDRYLVDVAKRNVQYYVNCPSPYSLESPSDVNPSNRKLNLKYKCYPVSMPIMYGPIYESKLLQPQKEEVQSHRTFPKNVRFVHGNYVLESEALLQNEQPQYDTIVCLSVTKWIHLNWGDAGLKCAFKRMFAQLKPGGILILEPQSWDSYKKKKSLTETIWRNYQSVQLFPHHFDRYLLSSEVGFSRCQTLAVVNHQYKGFRRAIKVFKKPMPSSTHFVSPYPVKEVQSP